ncbi:ATP-dependent DNA helicase [Trichonephila clavata]|uniref:ATP-dependent DNA helicase n=1 Tax=Trichonephila clavata TaxID=2740835 RepID=A0A8X6LKX8_TRICU|nr:ATP-dependent DNA helicase [Trichonephila clavata]
MGLPKLSAEEARKRRKESRRKWRMKPEAKQKKREVDKKRQTIYRALGKSEDCRKKYRSDPVKYEREMALQRERRARKRQNDQIGSDRKRLRLDAESEVLWDKTLSKFLQAISDGPIHRCICCDRLWFKHSISHQSKMGLQKKKILLVP